MSENLFGEPLREVYADGVEWDMHKALSQRQELQDSLRNVLGHRYADEVSHCSVVLSLQKRCDDGSLIVRPFYTCKRRWCPICSWRKSLKRWALLVERMPGLIEKNVPIRFLLLTLTVRNCAIDELPNTIDLMLKGWRALTAPRTVLGRQWPATAWLRALEITFPRSGQAHPHYHALLAVRPSYFSHGYVTQKAWTSNWRQALGVDYDPIVDVRRVKPLGGQQLPRELGEALGGLREVSKYVTKPSEQHSADALRGLFSLRGRRFIECGGWLRGVFSDADDDGDDLPDAETVAIYWWRAAENLYRRRLGI